MLRALFENLADATEPACFMYQVFPMQEKGVSAMAFECRLLGKKFALSKKENRLEVLFCITGGMGLEWQAGGETKIKRQEILLLTDWEKQRKIHFTHYQMKGILVSFDLENKTFFSSLPGAIWANGADWIRQAEEIIKGIQGCAVIGDTLWKNSVFAPVEKLSQTERMRYSVWKALELFYLLCSGYISLCSELNTDYYDAYQVKAVNRAHAYMMANLGESLTIEQLSSRFHISPTALKNCFRSLYGESIHRYLKGRRMRRAAELLAETPLSVVQIATYVGYSSVSQFGAAFKAYYLTTPAQYRRIIRKKNV